MLYMSLGKNTYKTKLFITIYIVNLKKNSWGRIRIENVVGPRFS